LTVAVLIWGTNRRPRAADQRKPVQAERSAKVMDQGAKSPPPSALATTKIVGRL